MFYRLNRRIGSMVAVLGGKVDSTLLDGGMVYNKELVTNRTTGQTEGESKQWSEA